MLMTNELKTEIDNWLNEETLEKRECEKLNLSLLEGEETYKLTITLKLNTKQKSKIITRSRLFTTFAQNNTSLNSKIDINRFRKFVDVLEKDFFDEQEKAINELTDL